MRDLRDGLRRPAQFHATDRAVDDLIVAALFRAGRGHFVLVNCLARSVRQFCNHLTVSQLCAAALAPGVAGIAFRCAGGFHGIPDLGLPGMVIRVDRDLLRLRLAAFSTDIGSYAGAYAGCCSGDRAIVPGMLVLHKARIERQIVVGRVTVSLAVRVCPSCKIIALAGDFFRSGQPAPHPVGGHDIPIVVLPGDVHHHRGALEDIGRVVRVEHRASIDDAPLGLVRLHLCQIGLIDPVIAVGVSLVGKIAADLLRQVFQHLLALQSGLLAGQFHILAVARIVQYPVRLIGMLGEVRVQRQIRIRRPCRSADILLAVFIRPISKVIPRSRRGFRLGQCAANPVTGGHVAVVVLPGDVHHHRGALEDIGRVVRVEHRASIDDAPLGLVRLHLCQIGLIDPVIAVGVSLVGKIAADLLRQVFQHLAENRR